MTAYRKEGEDITVRLPAELPVLTPTVARILLDILIEVTEVPVLERPAEGGGGDC
jgi:hypothetical protein